MKKKIEFEECFLFTVAIMLGIGCAIILFAPIIISVSEYKYSIYIIIYIAICGSIAYWILKKEENSVNNK